MRGTKHVLWVLFALFTGFTLIGYFAPIRDLPMQIIHLELGPWQWFWFLFYAFALWGNAGFLREQVCTHMCPYARFQGAMFDKDTMIVTYDKERGDPRGSRSKKADPGRPGPGQLHRLRPCASRSAPPASTSATACSTSASAVPPASTCATA